MTKYVEDLSADDIGSQIKFRLVVQNDKTLDSVTIKDRLAGIEAVAAHRFPSNEDEADEVPTIRLWLANVRIGPDDFLRSGSGTITVPYGTKIEVS